MLILYCPHCAEQAAKLAASLDMVCKPIAIHEFPDNEIKVTLPLPLPAEVVLFCSLDHPNSKLITLVLTAHAARENGVRRLILLAPYLCYMRQDAAFSPGEAVSQRSIGLLLDGLFDDLITVDPHLHRISSLNEVMPTTNVIVLTAAPAIAAYLAELQSKPLLLGPDRESEQWVRQIADIAGLQHGVAEKVRYGDQQVRITLPDIEFSARDIVLIDDMISSGTTLLQATAALFDKQVRSITCIVTHALFPPAMLKRFHDAGIDALISTDSISHVSNAISLNDLYVPAIKMLHLGGR